MIKQQLSACLFSFLFFSCGQSQVSKQTPGETVTTNAADTNLTKSYFFDTGKMVILPRDTSKVWMFKKTAILQLTNEDLQTIEQLLTDCINANNSKQDTTKMFSEYINLKNYKRQYVPFIDSTGAKKVYINCFCLPDYPDGFDCWKKSLVEVDDGGSCFFNLIINLTLGQHEQLYVNGPG